MIFIASSVTLYVMSNLVVTRIKVKRLVDFSPLNNCHDTYNPGNDVNLN